jgi:hypothetical protein
MEITFKTFNLTEKQTEEFWFRLKQLTVLGWTSRNLFQSFQNGFFWRKYVPIIRICYIENEPVAWALKFGNEIHCYTKPDFRCLGIQKNYLMPYMAHKFPCLKGQKFLDSQRKTFYYYEVNQKT